MFRQFRSQAALQAALLGGWAALSAGGAPPATHWVYFGTGASQVYVAAFDAASGALGAARPAAAIGRPGFLALHPRLPVLYAVGRETRPGSPPVGFVAAYAIDRADGSLRELNRAPTAGRGAAHVAVGPAGQALVAVNYGDGNTVSLRLEPDGSLGGLVSNIPHAGSSAHPQRQTQPHPHSANFAPDGRFVVVPDLGTDELLVYAVDPETARLERRAGAGARLPPGSGPRHLTFHPNGEWAYVINELASTVTLLRYGAEDGRLRPAAAASTLPADYAGPPNTTAEVLVHPSGRFLYGSNRGSNTIAVFEIDASDGRLAPIERVPTGGDWPRNFRLSPDGRFLLAANQRSDDVQVFRVAGPTGQLTPAGKKIAVPQPMCVRFVPVN